tara:strand:- start:110 stop:466 length:357 start_codon:yes stop_codon:yes gene_type:complete
MFKYAILNAASDNADWDSVSDEDRMYLYNEFILTKEGSIHFRECFTGEGNESKIIDVFSVILSPNAIEEFESISNNIFEILDEYLEGLMEIEFNSAKQELTLELGIDSEIDYLNRCGE